MNIAADIGPLFMPRRSDVAICTQRPKLCCRRLTVAHARVQQGTALTEASQQRESTSLHQYQVDPPGSADSLPMQQQHCARYQPTVSPEEQLDDVHHEGPWLMITNVLQQAVLVAAASALMLSMCITAPSAASAAVAWQAAHASQVVRQLPQHSQQQQRLLLLSSTPSMVHDRSSNSSDRESSILSWQLPPRAHASHPQQQKQQAMLPQQVQDEQQQQQQTHQMLFSMSSITEDSMLEAVRQMEARMDWAFGAVSNSIRFANAAQASSERAAADAQAQSLIQEVWEVVDMNYMDARQSGFDHDKWRQLKDQALSRTYYDQTSIHRAVRDMLAQGVPDPYCRFISPAEFASMRKYDVTGVGLNLGTAEEFVKKTGRPLPREASAGPAGVWVVGLSKGSEADRAGIEQGDQLLQIAEVAMTDVSPFQAATLIAGPDDVSASSAVGLKVKKADGQTVHVTVQRPARHLASPVTASLSDQSGRKVGTIHLSSFNARALRDVSAALDALQQKGAAELVLDLRDNRGGLVSEGLEVARLFLSDEVPIVLTQSKAMASEPPRASAAAATQLPLTVLVNEHTASASEILAGALKDNCRGVLVGRRTYGKGLIQSVYELSDTSGLVITVGKYLTPRGVDIDREGIAPNFSSKPAPSQAAAALNACRLEAGALSVAHGTVAS